MTATIDAPVTADEAVRPLDAELEKLRAAVQQAQEALQTAQTALEPLRARREALLTEDGDLDGLATEAASIAFDLDSGERKVAFLEERGNAIQVRIASAKAEREKVWVEADRPRFDAELRELYQAAALEHARFTGVARDEWLACPAVRRRWRDDWKPAPHAMVPGVVHTAPQQADLDRLIYPQPSYSQQAAHEKAFGPIQERARALEPRARRHGVQIEALSPLTSVKATIRAVESINREGK